MTIERIQILNLYKQLLRYSNTLVYTNKNYYLKRVKKRFKDNQNLVDPSDIEFHYNAGKSFLKSRFVKTKIDKSKIPKIDEKDLQESFINGFGPGGQNVNKRMNCVFLRHLPTNLFVKCHEFRDLESNRKQARKLLLTKLDNHLNGDQSVENQKKRIGLELKRRKEEQAKLRLEKKLKLKEHIKSLKTEESTESDEQLDNKEEIKLINQLDSLNKLEDK